LSVCYGSTSEVGDCTGFDVKNPGKKAVGTDAQLSDSRFAAMLDFAVWVGCGQPKWKPNLVWLSG
jgi:hypothetical protein